MDLSYNTGNIFPVPIHVFDIKDFNLYQKDLIDYAYTLRSKYPKTCKVQIMVLKVVLGGKLKDGNLRLSLLMMKVINCIVF